jgi:hypothetical protein
MAPEIRAAPITGTLAFHCRKITLPHDPMKIIWRLVSRRLSDYTERWPAFAGTNKEQNHGQGKGNKQGNEETGSKKPEGKKGRQTGQEARFRQRSDGPGTTLIARFSVGSDQCAQAGAFSCVGTRIRRINP